jgi:GNAT superfamily N-acetyltransferase
MSSRVGSAEVGDIERLTVADAADGLALSTEAGWNQTEADWALLLGAGIGFGIRNGSRRLVATSLALPYPPDFGWVSLVLVHSPYRRRGLATRLMGKAIDALHAANLVPMLDATHAGREVYASLGFSDVERINRWRGLGAGIAPRAKQDVSFDTVSRLDALAFGADRIPLLEVIARRSDSRMVLGTGGYTLIRHGRVASQIGPIVAATPGTSTRLLDLALERTAGPIVLDVPEYAQDLSAALEASGFTIERPFVRMSRAQPQRFGKCEFLFSTAGPELG